MIRHIVSISGGKDSTATALVARELVDHDELEFVFADTGNEEEVTYDYVFNYLPKALGFPITVLRADFAHEFEKKRANLARLAAGEPESAVYGAREFDYPWTQEAAARALELLHPTGNPYLDLCMVRGGFPSRKRQYCTEYLKRNPIVEHQGEWLERGVAVWSWQGVRADESDSRKHLRGTGACEKGFEVVGGGLYIRRPIIRWKAEDCFEAMRHCGVMPNPLYTQGFTRVGCFPCINASKNEISRIAKRYPQHVERIAEWERLVSAVTRPGSLATFFHVRTIAGAAEEDKGKNKMAEVVKWAKTTRGGKQYNLLDDAEEPTSCSSAYGLCE